MRALAVPFVIIACVRCGGGATPTAPSPPPAPAPLTITGTLTATNGGQPLSGVVLDAGMAHTTTSDAGAYSLSVPASAPTLTISLSRAGLIDRRTYVAPGTRTVNLDAIADGGGFDLNFYRQFVRDANESATLQPLRRWTTPPNVYLRTVQDDGRAVDSAMLDIVERVAREAIPAWSAGTLASASIERGTETRKGVAGWITITWPGPVGADRRCGQADVALSGGTVNLFTPTREACGCDGTLRLRPHAVRHELGHAMGYWHTDDANDVMSASSGRCDSALSARERYHAAVAYRRPRGNSDPDTDPIGTVNLAPLRVQ